VELDSPLPESVGGAVYAGRASWDGNPAHDAVVNIGARPTFAEGGCSVEVHILDFSGDLYGRRLEVRLLERLRPEQRFDSAEALISQVQRDIDQARAVLARDAQRP
jgi:riboflavin kinase/FMN adenylyltransferase